MLSDRDGEPVDPVPFLVVAGAGLLVSISFLPGYVVTLGGPSWVGVALALVVAGTFAILAYRRMVLAGREAAHREVPAEERLKTIVYGVLVAAALMAGLSLLLYLS